MKDKESNMQIIIDNKISEMEKKFNDKEQLLNKEIEVKNQNIKKQLDEFKRTKKQQEIEVMSELQKVEASKVKLDEQSLSIENQRRALQKEREEFMKDKKTLKTTLTNEVRSLGDQKNLVLKEIDLERKRMRDMESQYDKKIRQEYFAKVKDLETRRILQHKGFMGS